MCLVLVTFRCDNSSIISESYGDEKLLLPSCHLRCCAHATQLVSQLVAVRERSRVEPVIAELMSDGKQSLFEDSRLLPVNGDASQDESQHFRNATLFGAYANLITGIVGVGVLSFPYAFLQTGVYLNMIFTIAFGLINVYSITLMSRTFTERLIRTNQLKHATYEGVVMVTLFIFHRQS